MFFKEFQEMSVKQSILFSTGVVTVFFGVYLIATSQSNNKRDCEGDSQHLHCQNGESSSDRLTDLEKCDDKVIEFTRKRADSNVMIMTCIGSPVEIGEGRSSRKMGARNYSNGNSSSNSNGNGLSCKSSSYDGCDRYTGELSLNKGIYEDEGDLVREISVDEGGEGGEEEYEEKGENDSRMLLAPKNSSSSEKSSLLSVQNKLLSKQLQLQSQLIPCVASSIKNPLQTREFHSSSTSFTPSSIFIMKTPIFSNNSAKSEGTTTVASLPPNSGNKTLSKETSLPILDPSSSIKVEGSHLKGSSLRSLIPAIASPNIRIRSESACGLLDSDEDGAS